MKGSSEAIKHAIKAVPLWITETPKTNKMPVFGCPKENGSVAITRV